MEAGFYQSINTGERKAVLIATSAYLPFRDLRFLPSQATLLALAADYLRALLEKYAAGYAKVKPARAKAY
jgi:hypothetical protein